MSKITKEGYVILTANNRDELSHDWGGEFYYSEKEANRRCKNLSRIDDDYVFKAAPATITINKNDVENNSCEFGAEEEECYFCGQPRTIEFSEHYTFCPNCSAIYTTMIIQKSNCDHINNESRIPTVVREPWFANDRDKLHIYNRDKLHIYTGQIFRKGVIEYVQRCSICNKQCTVDGW